MNAIRLQADWRPLVGLGPADAGGLIERVIAKIVLDRAVELHNRDVKGG